MGLNFRFAIVSDLHIALPHTIWDNPSRFHLVEVSIPALEIVLKHLEQLDLDFLLLPGDLTQHGEPDNHAWLQERLSQLPFPVYVVPGNHDVPSLHATEKAIAFADFPHYYRKFGYDNPAQLYYTCQVLPGVRLIGLNSNIFDAEGKQIGRLDDRQIEWLKQVLAEASDELVLVMVHHNVVEHLPGQSRHSLGRRYMLENAPELLSILRSAGVQLVFTGHLHVQDIAHSQGIYDITTGSLVSYPHPYRILDFRTDKLGRKSLQVETHRIESVPDWPTLPQISRKWIADRSFPFMLRLLTEPPLSLPRATAEELAPSLRYFWADIAGGDATFDFAHFPPQARRFFESFGAISNNGTPTPIDNHATLLL
ncbi:metallophosphoesterase [Planktothrix sp. FACHB-1355]|uniref:Metallophosphoesterase n=1 Tax=Aerosakkonema funiforme FACHB-1375 TaxID=2949571 RepID=A0A926VKR5_9CYAN|nr:MULTISPECIES: metallophosphoesterase [Oscillatoriales]MBD2185058.1 metallophosphoesterase [Aerosakkonema funiforme FACHB-1375]MBD3558358.1 metallophosphoesterase [Planktothrix sp. FACHB-1355]